MSRSRDQNNTGRVLAQLGIPKRVYETDATRALTWEQNGSMTLPEKHRCQTIRKVGDAPRGDATE